HRRLVETALRGRIGEAALGGHPQSRFATRCDELTNAPKLAARDEGPEVEVSLGRPRAQGGETFAEPGHQLVVDSLVDEYPAAGRASLAGVLDDRADQHGQCGLEIGIGKDEL